MEDYRKKIIDSVLNNSAYQDAAKELSDDQKKKIEEILEGYVNHFSLNLIRAFSAAANPSASTKSLEIPSGSVITKENG